MPNLTGTARVLDRTQILRQVFDRHAPFLRYREDTASRISTGQASKISCVAPGAFPGLARASREANGRPDAYHSLRLNPLGRPDRRAQSPSKKEAPRRALD